MNLRELINKLEELSENGKNDNMEVINDVFDELVDLVIIDNNKVRIL